MAIEVKIICSRPNTNAPLWWKSTDPQILDICTEVENICKELNVQHTLIFSEDDRSYTSIFLHPSLSDYELFVIEMNTRISDWHTTRKKYLDDNNHSLSFVITDTESKVILRDSSSDY